MGELRREPVDGGLYGRLLARLALALEEADTAALLQRDLPGELELRDLTGAEVQLIRAYLSQDLNWLGGWHAAAEELAVIEQPLRKPAFKRAAPRLAVPSPAAEHLLLCCALCGTDAQWQRDSALQACRSCGSQLFRSRNPR